MFDYDPTFDGALRMVADAARLPRARSYQELASLFNVLTDRGWRLQEVVARVEVKWSAPEPLGFAPLRSFGDLRVAELTVVFVNETPHFMLHFPGMTRTFMVLEQPEIESHLELFESLASVEEGWSFIRDTPFAKRDELIDTGAELNWDYFDAESLSGYSDDGYPTDLPVFPAPLPLSCWDAWLWSRDRGVELGTATDRATHTPFHFRDDFGFTAHTTLAMLADPDEDPTDLLNTLAEATRRQSLVWDPTHGEHVLTPMLDDENADLAHRLRGRGSPR